MKKTLSIVLSLVMILTMLPTFAITAMADSTGGGCGSSSRENLQWVCDVPANTINIYSNTGKAEPMLNYEATLSPISEEGWGGAETANINKALNIGNYLFYNFTKLTTVTIDDYCTSIGIGAFGNCTSLTNVTLGNSMQILGDSAFHFCSKLTNITLPSSLERIGNYAFKDTGMKSIVVPSSVTEIGEDAFYGIDTVYYTGSAKGAPWGAKNVVNLAWSIDGDTLNITGLGAMPNWSYSGNNRAPWFPLKNTVTNVVIGKGITTIGSDAFYNCQFLINATIPNSVTSINKGAFKNCYKLKSATLPAALTSIGDSAFDGAIIKEFTVPCTVTSIGTEALFGADTVYYSGQAEGAPWGATEVAPNPGHYTAATCTAPASCSICKVTFGEPTAHSYTVEKIAQVNPTCTTAGTSAVMQCASCDATIGGEEIPATGHTLKTTVTKATTSKNGSKVTKCTVCGTQTATSTIYYPKTITLGATKYTYDGKAKKPTVTVKDSKGNKISSSNYTVAYSNNTKVGKATVKVTFKGNYSGTVSKTFTIVPKSTSISSLTAVSKGFTVKWNKQATQTTGYQIQIATDSGFTKGVKSYTVSKNSTVSKKITKLTAKKKYYVRIRTYKTVNGTKYYSAWSGYKTVTTKK